MKSRGVWSEPDRLLEFLFRLWHLPQDIIVFGHGLMGARRVRKVRKQSIDGLLGEQTACASEIVKEVGIVWTASQSRLQIDDGIRKLSSLQLRDSQRSFVIRLLQMRHCLRGVSLSEECVTQQLMGGRQFRT